jgi:hypothetical protein
MDNLKNFIEENRGGFENEQLLSGHKERFMKRLSATKSDPKIVFMPYWAKLAVASAIVILLAIPVFVNNRITKLESGEYYAQMLSEQSDRIEKMATGLDPGEKLNVESTLRQLEEETVPFADQLPESITSRERREIIKGYYTNKLEGADRLEKYVASLITK